MWIANERLQWRIGRAETAAWRVLGCRLRDPQPSSEAHTADGSEHLHGLMQDPRVAIHFGNVLDAHPAGHLDR